jgi:phosphonate transport system permease protein
VNPQTHPRRLVHATLLALTALTIWGFLDFDYKNIVIAEALRDFARDMGHMFLEARPQYFTWQDGLRQTGLALALAFLTTLIGALWGFVFGLLSARNLSSPAVCSTVRAVVAVIRAVPTVLWVLIFAIATGLGGTAAVLGMSFHSAGYLIKAFSESFEELDQGVIEALRAGGASWGQIVCQGIVPSSFNYMSAWTFMRFEINFAVAVAMGAAAGAGGIGYELFMASNYYHDIREVGFITYLVLACAAALELGSNQIRKRVLS